MISDNLLKNVVDLSVANFAIYSTPLSYDYKKELEENTHIEEVYFISQLMKISLSYASAKKFALGRNIHTGKIRDRKLVNVRNVIEYIKSPVSGKELSIQILQHINKLLTDGIVEIWDTGRLRNPEEKSSTSRIFKSQSIDGDIYSLVKENIDVLYKERISNNILKIARFLRNVYIICPFYSYNDETSVFIFKYMLKSYGFTPYICASRVLESNKEKLNKAVSSEDDWIEAFAEGLNEEIQNIYSKVKPRSLLKEGGKKDALLDLNRRQMRLLKYISDNGAISRELSSKLNNVSIATSYRDLDHLCRKNLIKREGIGKSTYYKALDYEAKA